MEKNALPNDILEKTEEFTSIKTAENKQK